MKRSTYARFGMASPLAIAAAVGSPVRRAPLRCSRDPLDPETPAGGDVSRLVTLHHGEWRNPARRPARLRAPTAEAEAATSRPTRPLAPRRGGAAWTNAFPPRR